MILTCEAWTTEINGLGDEFSAPVDEEYAAKYPIPQNVSGTKLCTVDCERLLSEEFISYVGGLGYRYDGMLRKTVADKQLANTWGVYIDVHFSHLDEKCRSTWNRSVSMLFRGADGKIICSYSGKL